mmetsp:Transcript_6390/g.8545  ORF Transcript_6390/g.8545 Transcript_6390/m.8545 type:complete len:835 (-) Transcript_6390:895-3399(-)
MIITPATAGQVPAGPVPSQPMPRTQLTAPSNTRGITHPKATATNRPSSMPPPPASAPASLSSTTSIPSPIPPSPSPSATLSSGSPAIAIKILVSNNASGSIIGRSGQTISDLQIQSSSRIKLSQSGDCFPGTTDRVCLIQGGLDNVKVAVNLIFRKLYDLQTAQHQQQAQSQQAYGESLRLHTDQEEGVLSNAAVASSAGQDHLAATISKTSELDGVRPETGRSSTGVASADNQMEAMASYSSRGTSIGASPLPFSVRILVPTPCCGMLIGRGGSNIKSMAEASGVSSIRLSPKETTEVGVTVGGNISSMVSSGLPSAAAAAVSATSERIVTVSGPDLNRCITCIKLILDGMAAHPEMCRYLNMTTSYTRAVSAAHAAVAAAAAQASTGMVSPTAGSIPSQPSVPAIASSSPQYHQRPQLISPPQSQQRQSHGGVLSQAPHLSLVLPSSVHPSSSISSLSQQPSLQTPLPPSQCHPIRRQESQNMGISSQRGGTSCSAGSPVIGPMVPPFTHGHASSSAHSQQPIPPPQQSMFVPTSQQASQSPAVPTVAYTQQHATIQKSSWQLRGSNTVSQHSPDISSAGVASASTATPSAIEQLSAQLQKTSPFSDSRRQPKTNSATDQVVQAGQSTPSQGQQQANIQIAVPDNLIGAILGRGGQTLTELQLCSHTRIQISQRGVFVPGTNHRIVTITGPTADNVTTAQFLINQRMARNVNRPVNTGGTSGSTANYRERMGGTDSRDSPEVGDQGQTHQQQQTPAQMLPSHTQQNYFLQSPATPSQTIPSSTVSHRQPQPQQYHTQGASSARPTQRRHQSHQHHHQRSKGDGNGGGSSTTG